ncbi:MAG: hypothetical protein K2G21_06485 [Muribaculaceae bacterium]|nr:hypothetical protein [Muribaculaceae bacterium]
MINHLSHITCRSILVGTLYTSRGILNQVIISKKGPTITVEPFIGESHSTSYTSRCAIIDRKLIENIDISSTLRNTCIEAQFENLRPALASIEDSQILMLALDQHPAIINI